MPVQVRLPTLLRQATDGASTVGAEGTTIGEVLNDLQRSYPALGGQMVTPEGKLHRFVNIYVNDDDVRFLEKLDTRVADGDVVSILPAVAGGA